MCLRRLFAEAGSPAARVKLAPALVIPFVHGEPLKVTSMNVTLRSSRDPFKGVSDYAEWLVFDYLMRFRSPRSDE